MLSTPSSTLLRSVASRSESHCAVLPPPPLVSNVRCLFLSLSSDARCFSNTDSTIRTRPSGRCDGGVGRDDAEDAAAASAAAAAAADRDGPDNDDAVDAIFGRQIDVF